MNIIAGTSVLDAISQIMYAIAIGIAFAALVIRKGVIWPLMIAHFLTDFFYFLQRTNGYFSPTQGLIITFSITVIFISYGLWLMFRPFKEPIRLRESLT
jgi:membrane protease YdiL (CAAX protease family)